MERKPLLKRPVGKTPVPPVKPAAKYGPGEKGVGQPTPAAQKAVPGQPRPAKPVPSGPRTVTVPGFGVQTVYPHEAMKCTCPVHGDTHMVAVVSSQLTLTALRDWLTVEFGCGCFWRSGGGPNSANAAAGWYRVADFKAKQFKVG